LLSRAFVTVRRFLRGRAIRRLRVGRGSFVTPQSKIGIADVAQNHTGFSFGTCAELSGACTDEGPHPGGLENLDGVKTFFSPSVV
jgi:hypothetical protein